ncbi:hypothetical protein CI102_7027 [Trichoderma harzianum]|nr:hypothetical protein CI102_7027 [Trichoderma harzianum]
MDCYITPLCITTAYYGVILSSCNWCAQTQATLHREECSLQVTHKASENNIHGVLPQSLAQGQAGDISRVNR